MVRYCVRCRFLKGDGQLVEKWLACLEHGHVQEVMACGAQSVEIIELDDSLPDFEIRYEFADRESLDEYLQKHSARLRAEGLAQFPPELGLEFTRTTGKVIFQSSRKR